MNIHFYIENIVILIVICKQIHKTHLKKEIPQPGYPSLLQFKTQHVRTMF